MDLCTLSDVKMFLGVSDDETSLDDKLYFIIKAVSAQVEKYLNRGVESTSRTEYFNVVDNQTAFVLKAFPITTVTSVKNSMAWEWSTTTALSSTYYNTDSTTGVLNIYASQLVAGADALQVVYTGGMASDVESLRLSDYADISLAALEQVCAVFNNRAYFGVAAANAGNSSASLSTARLLDSVKEILNPYRRLFHGT